MISGESDVRMILFILVLRLGGLLDTGATSVSGVFGGDVTIKCSHSNAFTNIKYFCKNPCTREDDILIRSSDTSNDKYSISDQGNTFTVTVYRLRDEDSGTYWCGIDRVGVDTFNRVVLTVEPPNTEEPDDDGALTESTSDASSLKLIYIAASLGVIVLVLAMGLLIFYRRRKRDVQASPGKDTDVLYASHSSQKPGRHDITSCMTAKRYEEPGNSSSNIHHQGSSDNIYSNASVSSLDVFYSTVSFNRHAAAAAAVSGHAAEVTYATVKRKAPEEPTVYQVTSGF